MYSWTDCYYSDTAKNKNGLMDINAHSHMLQNEYKIHYYEEIYVRANATWNQKEMLTYKVKGKMYIL